jgi:hypothetical protein
MRLVPLLLAALAAAPAGALPFSGTLGLSISRGLGAVSFSGSGSGQSTAGLVTVPPGVFSGTQGVPITYAPPFVYLRASAKNNLVGASGSPLVGAGAIRGLLTVSANLGMGATPLVHVPLALTTHATPSTAQVAAALGVGGTFASPAITVTFQGWHAGPATVMGVFPASMGPTGVSATATYTGTDSRTPGGVGQITLVSPAKIRMVGQLAPDYVLLGRLTLSFVPEPGTLAMLGTGVAGLGALGRRRRLARGSR